MSPLVKRLVYLTVDGALQPLGFSQIYRVVEGLGRRGFPYTLVSLERSRDLADHARVEALDARLQESGVEWRRDVYDDSGGGRAAAKNLTTLMRRTASLAARGDVRAIHARGYVAGFVANGARRLFRVPYVFDSRGYWIDERIDERQWFTTAQREAVARAVERRLFAEAAATVSLTQLQANDIAGGRFGDNGGRPAVCIPTCADFDDFQLKAPARIAEVPESIRARLDGKLVVGLVGSINASYLTDAMIDLARRVLERRPDAHLLVLTAQRDAYRVRLAGLDPARFTIEQADHRAMPGWLALIDWGLQLLAPERPAKRASMPTKLAEFFGSGVRPVHFGCNSEVDDWVRRTGSGVVLQRVDDRALDDAADAIARRGRDREGLATAREIAATHFSLTAGLDRYARLLHPLMS